MRIRSLVVLLTLVLLAPVSPLHASAPQENSTAASKLLDLNAATIPELETLPGVGARTAQRIVEYREKNGGFKKIEDLMNVQGIGEKSFLRLKPLITVTPPKTDRTTTQE